MWAAGPAALRGRVLKQFSAVLCAVALVGPAGCAPRPIESSYIGPPAAIERAITGYYRANATEEAGQCLRPYIDGITEVEVLEDRPEELIVHLRYFYRDQVVDPSDRHGPAGGCTGFNERIFVVADTLDGPRVVEMSGPDEEPVLRTLLRRGWEGLTGGG
jgi:hypothetical protein